MHQEEEEEKKGKLLLGVRGREMDGGIKKKILRDADISLILLVYKVKLKKGSCTLASVEEVRIFFAEFHELIIIYRVPDNVAVDTNGRIFW